MRFLDDTTGTGTPLVPPVLRFLQRGAQRALLLTCRLAAEFTTGTGQVLRVGVRGGWTENLPRPCISRAVSMDPGRARLLVVRFGVEELERVTDHMPPLLRALPGVNKVLLDTGLPAGFDPRPQAVPDVATRSTWDLARHLLRRLAVECPNVVFITPLPVFASEPEIKARFTSVLGAGGLMFVMAPNEEREAFIRDTHMGSRFAFHDPLGFTDHAFCWAGSARFTAGVGPGTRRLLERAFAGSPELQWLAQPPAVRFLANEMQSDGHYRFVDCTHVCVGAENVAHWRSVACGVALSDMLKDVTDIAISDPGVLPGTVVGVRGDAPLRDTTAICDILALDGARRSLRLPLRMLGVLVTSRIIRELLDFTAPVTVRVVADRDTDERSFVGLYGVSPLTAALKSPFVRVRELLCFPVPVVGEAELHAMATGPSTGAIGGMVRVAAGTAPALVETALARNPLLRLAPLD